MVGPDSGGAPAEAIRTVPSFKLPEQHHQKNFTPLKKTNHFADQKYEIPNFFAPEKLGKPDVVGVDSYAEPTMTHTPEMPDEIPPELKKMLDQMKAEAKKDSASPKIEQQLDQTFKREANQKTVRRTSGDINSFIRDFFEKIRTAFRNLIR